MWETTYHRFADQAAYQAACEAASITLDGLGAGGADGIAVDAIGSIPGEPAGYYVLARWFSREPPGDFASTVVTLTSPPRVWA